ncbi:DUF3087 domain-containing protein [Pseudoalteromonas ruthenica]|uniref:DUF3087 domain-containing protein n=1 Tax=Pseudoalteromonas ruthenica TaxID=151081 RepID=A0A0F4PS59_9GAMM|nr:DUF3087 domain-containing protein [Pseudoalteromonas ruthenica]KJY97096.1 hypothetical protein TW72_14775 [Pseudoalteromonas ruthenica]KJY99408.1 hypothetical protein TW76_03125 [Pseudoalteromonas ruthenica]TMO86901.1 DUF3087 domain-containing protein [Pseudoalteromonas ruthenica]TMO93519.1 DUF3087 domain-containing protein [Pseudoalteromonas ruthenica]TMO96323.1 DUF3087 domain-containing protein [Pseudoalteromonas ruthenica]
MKLQQIDKARYRKHLNRVLAACIGALVLGSLGIARLLIIAFPSASGSHFHWNLLGVIITCAAIALVLKRVQHHPYLREVLYVWHLKQALNQITRRLRKIKAAAEQGNVEAMHALQFNYSGSRQLWQLDDNTITMDELALEQAKLDTLAERYQVEPSAERYHSSTLKQF